MYTAVGKEQLLLERSLSPDNGTRLPPHSRRRAKIRALPNFILDPCKRKIRGPTLAPRCSLAG